MTASGVIGPGERVIERGGRMERPLVWQGGPLAKVDPFTMRQWWYRSGDRPPPRVGDVVILDSFPVQVVQVPGDWGGSYLVMAAGWRGPVIALALRLTTIGQALPRRIILTAAVWGFARWPDGRTPRWTDIHAIRWLAQRRQHGRTR